MRPKWESSQPWLSENIVTSGVASPKKLWGARNILEGQTI